MTAVTSAPSGVDHVTLVTEYFNLGSFPKTYTEWRTSGEYRKWMSHFGRVRNPVVAYFDDSIFASGFNEIRAAASLENRTKIIQVQRNTTWAFSLLPAIKGIVSDPEYPRMPPQDLVPEYACAMHAKYEFMLETVRLNPFQTKYFAWVDIGLFRFEKKNDKRIFSIRLPPGFNSSRIAYNEVYERVTQAPPEAIFLTNAIWLCGCFFIGAASQMIRWTQHYMHYVQMALNRGLTSTDQQVLYAMVNDPRFRLSVDLQVYGSSENWTNEISNKWYHLGYLCKV